MTRDQLLAARTSAWTDDERAALVAIVATLRPSAHHLGDALDWLDDLAARDGGRPASALDRPELQAALAAPGSAPDRWKRWKEALRRLRYPRLAARERAFAAAVRALDLGRNVAIAPSPAFEGGRVTVTIRAATVDELVASLDRLAEARAADDLARLFALLDA
ncbi:MAG: hypothetical protein IT294_19285 [Deltaproteobacteria bacterium]|nr:hypothetical protein [Deltaproteobacteria bacterium]